MWFVSREEEEEAVFPHYSGQPFQGPGASLPRECQSLASSRVQQGLQPAGHVHTGRGRLGACLAAQQPF